MSTKAIKVVKQATTTKDLQHMSPSKFSALGIINFPNPLNPSETVVGHFEIFDGVAFGNAVINDEPREVIAEYPLLNLVNKTATNMKENICAHLNITEERDVTIFEILASYGRFKVLN